MLRNEIQIKTGLTRKGIEYYEKKGLIKPIKLENGFKDYSKTDLEVLNKVSLFRKVGMSISEIKNCLFIDESLLSSILRKKQYKLEIDDRKNEIIELIINGENPNIINEKIKIIESEEKMYETLERLFPGYLGQMLFMAYKPFLNEPLKKDGKKYFENYIRFIDSLPLFELTRDEQIYIDNISSSIDMITLKKVNESKIKNIENVEEFIIENGDIISKYEEYKNSDEYKGSLLNQITNKFQKFMIENKYYEIAIPLIRKFSNSYDEYYKKLINANEIYLDINNNIKNKYQNS